MEDNNKPNWQLSLIALGISILALLINLFK